MVPDAYQLNLGGIVIHFELIYCSKDKDRELVYDSDF
jgi:hypothetical protein